MERRIAIVGGTGDLGLGLAVRLAGRYDVVIGSRDPARATDAASRAASISGRKISGMTNEGATKECDVAILAIPNLPSDEALLALKTSLEGKLVISPIVPMEFKDGLFLYSLAAGSATERVASILKTRVAGAFHNIPAAKLLRVDREVDYDVLVTAEERSVYEAAAEVVSSVSKLRPLYAGPLSASRFVEWITPSLLNIGKLNGMKSPSIRVT